MGQDEALASGWEAHYKSLFCCLNTHKRCIKKKGRPPLTLPCCVLAVPPHMGMTMEQKRPIKV